MSSNRKTSYETLGSEIQAAGQSAIDHQFGFEYDPQSLTAAIDEHLCGSSVNARRPESSTIWLSGRIRNQAVMGGLVHLACSKAIASSDIMTADFEPDVSGPEVLVQFDRLTKDLYLNSGLELVAQANRTPHRLYAAGQFCLKAAQDIYDAEAGKGFNPFKTGGKLWIMRVQGERPEAALDADAVTRLLLTNTDSTNQLLTLRAIAHTIANGGTPQDSKDLAVIIKAESDSLVALSTGVLQHHNEWVYGRSAALAMRSKMRAMSVLPLDKLKAAFQEWMVFFENVKWNKAIELFLHNTDPGSFLLRPMDVPLLEPELPKIDITKTGRCTGTTAFLPEKGISETVWSEIAKYGYPIDAAGRFSVAAFQFAHGLRVAEHTLFANEAYRNAIAQAAKFIMRSSIN